ncbi:MAG: hypothetical protein AAF961_03395 [Planctomycetota bacterium]
MEKERVARRLLGGMNTSEAYELLSLALRRYRNAPYRSLVKRIAKGVDARKIRGPSGVEYAIEIQVYWDRLPEGDLMVLGAVDDGRLAGSRKPLCDDFIMSPDGLIRSSGEDDCAAKASHE